MRYASRPPAVAGTFYPGSEAALDALLRHLLDDATTAAPGPDDESGGDDLEALIVPHAGYRYSGSTAAAGYALLAGRADRAGRPGRIERVAVLGPAHRVAIRGLARSSAAAFDTPLGKLPLADPDPTWAGLPQVVLSDEAHRLEHSLEVQLPFLLHQLGPVPIVPLVVGHATPDEVAEVIDALTVPGTLIVISTDLSHYHPAEQARRLDAATIARILDLDPTIGHDRACGAIPLTGYLTARGRRVPDRPDPGMRLLAARNSGDTGGDSHRVVGYAAFAVRREARDRS